MNRWIAGLACCLSCLPITVAPLTVALALERLPAYSDAAAMRKDATLRSVAFANEEIGIACGDRGTILRTPDGGASWQAIDSPVQCQLDDVIWLDQNWAVIVGGSYDKITQLSRGVVLYSQDGGRSWQRTADEELTRLKGLALQSDGSLTADCEWSHSLLTRRLVSRDRGRNWNDASGVAGDAGTAAQSSAQKQSPTLSQMLRWSRSTKLPIAIRNACRMGDTTYCAVGDHGVILVSEDQGQSWRCVRGKARQTAVLFVANSPESVAWSMLGSETLESRNRVSLLLNQNQNQDQDQLAASQFDLAITNQVAVMLGGAGTDAFQSTQEDLVKTASSWITIHQPTVVVLDETLPTATRDAFFRAATNLGVQRVAIYGLDGQGGSTALHRDALLPKCGVLASDLQADAMHYISPHQTIRSSITVRYPYDISPNRRRGGSVTSGLRQRDEQKLASSSSPASRHQLQIVQARLQQTKRIETIIRSSLHSADFKESVDKTLDQTAKADQFRVAWSFLQATRPDRRDVSTTFHEVALEQIASRFPSTSAGRWAALRHAAIQNSLEWQRLRSTLSQSLAPTRVRPATEAVAVSPFQIETEAVQQVSAGSPLLVPKPERLHVATSEQAASTSAEIDLPWEFHPLVLVAREAARRRSDEGKLQVAGDESADLQRLAQSRDSEWAPLLRDDGGTVLAHRANTPPKLDGDLSDRCWQSALPSAGRSPHIRLAYDEEYVYVAMQCPTSRFETDPFAQQSDAKNRDQDLKDVDRLLLSIDTDRDLITSMQLQVSDSGRTHDAIDGNPHWQPTWYRDTKRDQDQLTIEIAILRRDLVELPIPPGDTWFLSARILTAGDDADTELMPHPRHWFRVRFE